MEIFTAYLYSCGLILNIILLLALSWVVWAYFYRINGIIPCPYQKGFYTILTIRRNTYKAKRFRKIYYFYNWAYYVKKIKIQSALSKAADL